MRIPDGWFDYDGIKKPIEGVPIVAFKTPLSKVYHRPEGCTTDDVFVEKDQEFTPLDVLKKLEDDGFELAVVIDLTFTFRYYNGEIEFENENGVQYDKVKCAGQQIPNDEVVERVASIINDVILENGKDSKKLVGIHCTHGVNRTGYILSRYLIEWHNFEPEKAIEAVGESRGHPIEREPYLEDLKKRTPKNGFEQWKTRQDFSVDEPCNEADFATNNTFSQFQDGNQRANVAKERGESDRWEHHNNQRSHGYDNNYYPSSRHERRDNFNDRYVPYNRYKRQHEYRDNRDSPSNHRNEDDNTRFQRDDFEPSKSGDESIVRPPPSW